MARRRSDGDARPRRSRRPFDILAMLPADLQALFLERVQLRRYAEGQIIYSQGDSAAELFRIVHGTVRISYVDEDGRQVVYLHYEPNDCFGYSDLIDGEGLPHTAEAFSEVEVQTLSRSAFEAMRVHHAFNDALLRLLCGYMRLLSSTVARVTLEGLETRLAIRLLQAARPNGAGLPSVRLSQSELGMMVGATRQSVNKLLREFQEDGLVELAYGRVLLRNTGALQRRAKGGQ